MRVVSGGFGIHYEAAGQGTPLLLIHGTLQSAQRWIDCGYLSSLSDQFRAIAVDLLGHGESDKPHDSAHYTVENQVEHLVAVLDGEQAAVAHLWAYSGGAVLAAALADRVPDRVRSVVLGGIPPDLPPEARPMVFQPLIDALRARDWTAVWERFVPLDQATRDLMQAQNDPEAVGAFIEGVMLSAPNAGPVSKPTLMYEGSDEPFFEMAKTTARDSGAEFVVVEGRGHAGAFQDRQAIEAHARTFFYALTQGPRRLSAPNRH